MLQQAVAVPGNSRVCQALRTLHPDVHTVGDLVAMVGGAALAQVILKVEENMLWTVHLWPSIIYAIEQLTH
jgi:hypothetical protein